MLLKKDSGIKRWFSVLEDFGEERGFDFVFCGCRQKLC